MTQLFTFPQILVHDEAGTIKRQTQPLNRGRATVVSPTKSTGGTLSVKGAYEKSSLIRGLCYPILTHPKPPTAKSTMLRKRQKTAAAASETESPPGDEMPSASGWMFFAVASGACAAFNGVFAKLTTTELTTTLSNWIAQLLGLSSVEHIVEYVVRALFFALNLTFNGVMWTLFTKALARGTSTTQVSIMNTSTNFMVTALLGALIFSEALPPLWWAGAALLVAGNVIVGRKGETKDAAEGPAYAPVPEEEEDARKNDDEDIIDLGRLSDERSR